MVRVYKFTEGGALANESLVEALASALEKITRYNDAELISRPEWGVINFEKAKSDIDLVLSIANDLSDLPLHYLTDTVTQQITNHIPKVEAQLKQVDEFNLEGDPSGKRDGTTASLHQVAEQLQTISSPWIPYLAYKRGDISQNIAQLNKAVSDAQGALSGAETWITDKKDEIGGIVQAAREASASAGVATFTQEFDTESTALSNRSKTWLWLTGILAVVTIVAAIVLYFWPPVPKDANSWYSIRHTVSKVTVIAVLFSATVWCGHIYRALIHQATINRHRALSLKTFQAFVKATEDPRVRDAVLMAATKTVFGAMPTGLIDGGKGDQEPNIQFVEIGKALAEKAADVASK